MTPALLFLLYLLLLAPVFANSKQSLNAPSDKRKFEFQIMRRLPKNVLFARPVTKNDESLQARIRISLIKIQNLWERTDVKTEALELTLRIQLNWCDDGLGWNPKRYGGVDNVIIPGDRLWIPDIQIINALDDVYTLVRDRRFDFKLYSDGCVWWYPTGTIFTRCQLDLSFFPFDEQSCPIIFESAMYPKELLNLTTRHDKSAVSLNTFTASGQWDLITAFANSKLNYVTESTAFSRVEVILLIRRKTLYYKMNAFFPCGLLSGLQILTFFLPIGSVDRISQSTTILLSVIVFQSIVVGELPRTSNSVPLLCIYIDFLTGISVLTISDAIIGVYVLDKSNRHGRFAKILRSLGMALEWNRPKKSERTFAVVVSKSALSKASDVEKDSLETTSLQTSSFNLDRHFRYYQQPVDEPVISDKKNPNYDDSDARALEKGAVLIDNAVFFIAMTSCIAVPIYMFVIIPPMERHSTKQMQLN